MARLHSVFVYANGNVAVVNERGEQMPDFQGSWTRRCDQILAAATQDTKWYAMGRVACFLAERGIAVERSANSADTNPERALTFTRERMSAMGQYYRLVNSMRREWIDPSQIGGGSCKYEGVVLGPVANLYTFLQMYAEYNGDWRIVSDGSGNDAYYEAKRTYQDVTEVMCLLYNDMFPEHPIEKLRP